MIKTGIKTLCKKICQSIRYPDTIYTKYNPKDDEIPEHGISYWKIKLKLYSIKNNLKYIYNFPRLNEIHNYPHKTAIKTWKTLLPYNPNNIGNWSISSTNLVGKTQKIERSLIRSLIKLYGGSLKNWEGYVTNGGTESNLYSAWIGRNALKINTPIQSICLIKNDLTHYSINKISNILNLNLYSTNLNHQTWSFDIYSMEKTILRLIKNQYRGFIIPITLGYTQTGTNDDYQQIINLLEKLKREKGIFYYTFIDAALNGLVLPFYKKNFKPLKAKNIGSISTDFHKLGMTPLSCGIILYKKKLRKNISFNIPYSVNDDSTLSGSRSGISSTAAYMVTISLGKQGFLKLIKKNIISKNKFIKKIKSKFPNVEIINPKESTTIGIASKKKLPEYFTNQYGLYAKKNIYHFKNETKNIFIYKATFISKL